MCSFKVQGTHKIHENAKYLTHAYDYYVLILKLYIRCVQLSSQNSYISVNRSPMGRRFRKNLMASFLLGTHMVT